jgi:steroid delta-isomerase-like uncharacterized protein
MSTTETENKEVVQRFVTEMCNGRGYDLAEELFTADYTRHDPANPEMEQGPSAWVDSLKQMHAAFPDQEIHIGEIIANDDLVAFEGIMTGTHEGTFAGIEPTNVSFEVQGNSMHRVNEGKIAETWATWDVLGILQQVGAIDLPLE